MADTHLNNLVRQVRDRLTANNPVQAFICLEDLQNYLHGKRMDGTPWKQ